MHAVTGSAAEPEPNVGRRRLVPVHTARYSRYALSVVLFFGLWYWASGGLVSERVMPTPDQTVRAFFDSLEDGYVWSDFRVTFIRMTVGFLLAMSAGVVVGFALGRVRWLEVIFGPWVTVGATIPSILYIIVLYLWLGLNDRAAVLGAAAIVGPTMIYNIWQGVKTLDPGLSEMARAYEFPRTMVLRRVFLPQTYPFIFASARQGLAITWKIMILVELLGRPSGVGFRINFYYQLLQMDRVLAAALLFVIAMLLIELVLVRRVERYVFRWQRAEAR